MNEKNLIPNTERSPEELREMGRKGGIASGRARRRKRDLRKLASMLLDKQMYSAISATLKRGKLASMLLDKQIADSFKEMVGMKDDE